MKQSVPISLYLATEIARVVRECRKVPSLVLRRRTSVATTTATAMHLPALGGSCTPLYDDAI